MVDEMPNNSSQVKKVYRQNLALNAFSKNKGSMGVPQRTYTRPQVAPKIIPQMPVESPVAVVQQQGQRRPDITFSPEKLESPLQVNTQPYPQANDSAYDGIATFSFGGAATTGTAQIPNLKEATPTSGSSAGGREKPKIFESYKERQSPAAVNEPSSFNTFSHDMFNTVSLPAQVNQDRPSMDNSWSQNSNMQNSNRPSTATDLSQMDFDLLGSISYSNPAPVQNQNKNQNLGFSSMPNTSHMNQNSAKNTQAIASSDPWDLLDIVSGPSTNTNTTSNNNPSSYLSQSYSQPKPTTPSNQQPSWNNFGMSQSNFPMQVPQTTATLKVLKVMEKFYVTLKNSKVQNLKVAGQIAAEVEDKNFGSSATLGMYLTPTDFWENESKVSKRPSRKDLILSNTNGFYKLQLGTSNGNVPLFDYLVAPKSLDPGRIPIFFIYKVETAMNGVSNLLLQYKVNEKLNQTFLDVDIVVNFKENISNYGIKTIPTANKISDRQVSWKAKSLGPDSKGKLGVSFERFNGSVDNLIEDFRLTLKGMALINDQMYAYGTMSQTASPNQYMDSNVFAPAQKRSIIEYKILPNDLL